MARDGEYSQVARLGTAAVFTDGLAVSSDALDAAAAAAIGGTRNLRSFFDRLGRTQRVEDLIQKKLNAGDAQIYFIPRHN